MNQRLPGPVALILLQQAWRLRLQISGFNDLESADDPDGPLRGWHNEVRGLADAAHHPAVHPDRLDTRGEYYRRLGIESYRQPPPRTGHKVIVSGWGQITPMSRSKAKDRKILRLLADGTPIRKVMHQLHVGQGRVYRLLSKIKDRIRRETRYGKTTG